MGTEKHDAEIKTRVPQPVKASVIAIANARHLDAADIVREALREYLAKHERASGNGSPEPSAAAA